MEKHIYRIIDANINRAMEGLRVCEDLVRFSDYSEGSVKFKEFRHVISRLAKTFPEASLLNSRNVDNDDQKFIDLESEKKRASIEDLFTANIHRAIEALRTLEECLKLNEDINSTGIEEIRFSLYNLEKEITLSLMRNRKKEKFKNSLYAIIDSAFVPGGNFLDAANKLIRGGAEILQLRMKNEPMGKILDTSVKLNKICKENNVLFIVNDFADIAYISDADGLHLGQDDIPVEDARKVLKGDKIIGLSTHSIEQALDARDRKPDYIAIGPIFNTISKTGRQIEGIGSGVINKIIAETDLPIVAIGGINENNIKEIADAGCDSFSVISGLFKDNSIIENCRRILSKIK